MTVVNVTNAVLKGSVKGPTFTGNVDGATFTGSVTYTDTTTPPVEPPTTGGPTGGRITAFSNASGGTSTIDGQNYSSHTYGNSQTWSKKKLDDYTIRYEVRQGTGGWNSSVDVSEIQAHAKQRDGTENKIAFRLMVEAGAKNSASWMVCGLEIHNDDQAAGAATSPPIAIYLDRERLWVTYRYLLPGGRPGPDGSSDVRYVVGWKQPADLVRGKWYVFEIEYKFSQTAGYYRVKLDGQQIVNHSGALGYGFSTYAMTGIYRAAAAETFVIQVKNLTVSWATQGDSDAE